MVCLINFRLRFQPRSGPLSGSTFWGLLGRLDAHNDDFRVPSGSLRTLKGTPNGSQREQETSKELSWRVLLAIQRPLGCYWAPLGGSLEATERLLGVARRPRSTQGLIFLDVPSIWPPFFMDRCITFEHGFANRHKSML